MCSDIGDGRIQQDRALISPDGTRAVLCDGHGLYGHDYADVVCNFLMSIKNDDTIHRLFSRTSTHVKETMGDKHGGTCCSYVSFDAERNMTVANLGDSSVHYWDTFGSGISVSKDHSPTRLHEFQRIRNAGGECVFDDQRGRYPKGSQPVYLQEDFFLSFNAAGGNYHKNCRNEWAAYFQTPLTAKDEEAAILFGTPAEQHRLAVTRAFGDWPLVPYGLISEPSVQVVRPPTQNTVRAVVIASDGLWDGLQDVEIGAIVRRKEFLENRNAYGAAQALVSAGLVAGRRMFGENQDNTTVIVLYL
jgi:serine/threonine protein phosphatase PrpC